MPTFWKTDLPPLPKQEKEKKTPKPIPKISEKKKKRLKEEGSETELFMEIWSEREHKCEVCGFPLTTPRPHNFDHIKGKKMNSSKRLDKENIQILCFAHHFEKTTGLKYKGVNLD